MNGLIRKAALLLAGALGAAGAGCQTTLPGSCGTGGCGAMGVAHKHGAAGCPGGVDDPNPGCKDLYDRCWPQRDSNLSHRAVNRAFTPQVQNGHVLDQTIWNQHFECGTARLNPAGLAQLQQISRRRPEVDRTVYVATSLDLEYDPACPDRYCGARQELDGLRVAAVQKYLVGLNCGRCQDFQVLVHDPADVTLHSNAVSRTVMGMYGQFRGGIGGGGGGGAVAGPTGTVGGFAGAGGAANR